MSTAHKQTILSLVNNAVDYDARVKRQAKVLKQAGYAVIFLGRLEGNVLPEEQREGITYLRIPIQFSILRLVRHFFFYAKGLPRLWVTRARWVTGLWICVTFPCLFLCLIVWGILRFCLVFSSASQGWVMRSMNRFKIFFKAYLAHFFLASILFEEVNCALTEKALLIKPDIIHAHDLETLRVAYRVATALKIPFIYDSHELERHRNDRASFWNRMIIWAEESAYIRQAARVITVSEPIATQLSQFYDIPAPLVLYNSPMIAEARSLQGGIRSDLALSVETPLLVYVGLVTFDRCLMEILKSLVFLPGWHLAFLGPQNETEATALQSEAKKMGLESRFHLIKAIESDQVVSYIDAADVGIIMLKNMCQSYEYAMPSKLFEMSFAGLPMVVSDLNEMKRYVTQYALGEVLEAPLTPERMASKVQFVYQNKSIYRSTEKALDLQRQYGWETQSQLLEKLYAQVLQKNTMNIGEVICVE